MRRRRVGNLTGVLVLALGACSGPRYVPGSDPEFPRVEYAETVVSANDRCPVRKNQLNRRMPPLHGEHTREILREMGFSDADLQRLQTEGIIPA